MFTHILAGLNVNLAMYIDPATTSYIIQIGAGLIIALGTVLGIFWSKIKRLFTKKDKSEDVAPEMIKGDNKGVDIVTADDLMDDDDDDDDY